MNLSSDTKLKNLNNNIWLTYKARIYAEKRYKSYNNSAHLYTALISFSLIAASLLFGQTTSNTLVNSILVSGSVLILAISLITFGFHFGETAVMHRECYLSLQEIYNDENMELSDKKDRYISILKSYPNHSDIDFHRLGISDPNAKRNCGELVRKTPWSYFVIFAHWLTVWVFPAFLYTFAVCLLVIIQSTS